MDPKGKSLPTLAPRGPDVVASAPVPAPLPKKNSVACLPCKQAKRKVSHRSFVFRRRRLEAPGGARRTLTSRLIFSALDVRLRVKPAKTLKPNAYSILPSILAEKPLENVSSMNEIISGPYFLLC